jgi:hypothetical protein
VSSNGASTIPGRITTSTCWGGGTTFSAAQPEHPAEGPISFILGSSFLTFIIPQTTRMKTRVCTRRPMVDGQPLGVAMRGPRTRLTRRKVSGFAMMKKVRPEMREVTNFSCCFWPLHPQPQSLKRPMIIFSVCQQKNVGIL